MRNFHFSVFQYDFIQLDLVNTHKKTNPNLQQLGRKIQLELAKENQPNEGELPDQVANSDVATDVTCRQDSQRKGLRP